jgi:hypothetical protein
LVIRLADVEFGDDLAPRAGGSGGVLLRYGSSALLAHSGYFLAGEERLVVGFGGGDVGRRVGSRVGCLAGCRLRRRRGHGFVEALPQ